MPMVVRSIVLHHARAVHAVSRWQAAGSSMMRPEHWSGAPRTRRLLRISLPRRYDRGHEVGRWGGSGRADGRAGDRVRLWPGWWTWLHSDFRRPGRSQGVRTPDSSGEGQGAGSVGNPQHRQQCVQGVGIGVGGITQASCSCMCESRARYRIAGVRQVDAERRGTESQRSGAATQTGRSERCSGNTRLRSPGGAGFRRPARGPGCA